jgi:hypothetical protein
MSKYPKLQLDTIRNVCMTRNKKYIKKNNGRISVNYACCSAVNLIVSTLFNNKYAKISTVGQTMVIAKFDHLTSMLLMKSNEERSIPT